MSTPFLNVPESRRNRYLLMRHGHSRANEQGVIVSTPRRGLGAFGLSPEGEAQLESLMAGWCWPAPTRVLHSDFLRTTETAARVAARFGITPRGEPRLRERCFGDFEGESDAQYERVWTLDARDPAHCEHGVESVTSVAARMQSVLASLERELNGETVLLVSHGDPLQILLAMLESGAPGQHRRRQALAPASVTELS